MTDQDLLRSAYIPENEWDQCLVAGGMVFVPEGDLTAQEVYDRFLHPPEPEPSDDLQSEINRLKPYEEGFKILIGEGGEQT